MTGHFHCFRGQVPPPCSLFSSRGIHTGLDDRFIRKNLLSGELASGKRPTGRPSLHYKDVCKCDLNALTIDSSTRLSLRPKCLEARSAERSLQPEAVEKRAE